MSIHNGWLEGARRAHCQHFDARPAVHDISLLVIHNICLPPAQFEDDHVEQFFAGKLDVNAHPFFTDIADLRVSSHLYIRRSGEVVQFVSFLDRAWHAGVSSFQGRTRCNDFSIGIELQGTDNIPYTQVQYSVLLEVTSQLRVAFPAIGLGRIVGHCDIAPFRKTDPGPAFEWGQFRQQLEKLT